MNIIYSALVLTVWFMSTFFVILVLLVVFDRRKHMSSSVEVSNLPRVSIILPAYNEEEGICAALESLAAIDYPKSLYEILAVNDGSSDQTSERIRSFVANHKDINIRFIDRKKNCGKAHSLNEGIKAATGDYVACMDGDSIVDSDILSKTVGYFQDPKVASVSVRVNVRNPRTLLEKIIDVEFSVGLSTSLKVLSFLDSMHVTPGPFSIYRKSVLSELGGFDEENITEDMEIALRMQKAGYRLVFCLSTSVSTTVPTTLSSLYKQRRRWYSGSLLTLWQHRDIFSRKDAGLFRMFLLFNYALIFLGLGLFFYSIYLYVTNGLKAYNYLRLIDFDILNTPLVFAFDLLSLDIFTTLAVTSVLITVVLVSVSMGLLKRDIRTNLSGFLGYLFFFVFYQIFWINSLYNVVRKRHIKWR
jgi:cellulose synthase/poly-beta-1,6-N-acetylglucosamine synthase-like glycosyltransferase